MSLVRTSILNVLHVCVACLSRMRLTVVKGDSLRKMQENFQSIQNSPFSSNFALQFCLRFCYFFVLAYFFLLSLRKLKRFSFFSVFMFLAKCRDKSSCVYLFAY